MATTDANLRFIREKIYETRNAVMYSMSNELVKIPNNIVTVLRVDDNGELWFFCTPPSFKIEECECVFPARLHFYKKGKFFHLEVSGRATIVNNEFHCVLPAEYRQEEKREKPVLIKMSMTNVEYTSAAERREKNRLETMLENGYRWLLRNVALAREEKSVFSKLHQSS